MGIVRDRWVERSREQDNAVEALSLDHGGEVEVEVIRVDGEPVARVRCADGSVGTVDEDGTTLLVVRGGGAGA